MQWHAAAPTTSGGHSPRGNLSALSAWPTGHNYSISECVGSAIQRESSKSSADNGQTVDQQPYHSHNQRHGSQHSSKNSEGSP